MTPSPEEPKCCNEYGCKRKQPFHISRSPLTGTWYVLTKYKDLGDGHFVAAEKHKLPEQYQRELNEAFPPRDDETGE